MSQEFKDVAKRTMTKSVESFVQEIAKLRSGRAHPNLLDHIKIENYGVETPLKQVASVVVEDARTLAVTPWEKSLVGKIEKAIRVSNLGINPVVNGGIVRVPMPALTEERRLDLVKIARAEAEQARVSVRNNRRQVLADVKQQVKDKVLTPDEERDITNQIQTITDQSIKDIDTHLEHKEKDLTSV
ncbi:MAG: ribosome recycling factor [Legionellales bacterium]|nr:ribosome recycling factor [Legionellales bacterium]OUX66937.1 MAG: ribosome recycling factor [bacterium TMED178]|tara:strand:- start:1178 stop:1735 length:558 start_codon:yes stop_codon:yes gene_type:complete